MGTFFFCYTLAMLFVCVVAASICVATYAVTHRKRHLPQAGFFAAYFLELSSIFAEEWAGLNVSVVTTDNYYAVSLPVLRIAEGAAILECLWFVVLDIMDMREGRTIAVSTAAFVVLSAIPLVALPYGPLRQWCFYTARQVSLAACLILAYVRYRRSPDELYRQRMHRHASIFAAVCVLVVCIFLEDTYVILLAPIPGPDSPFVGLFLSTRSFSENVMMLVVAYVVTKRNIETLSLRYNEPPESQTQGSERSKNLQGHIEDRLPAYAQAHGLSKRESEILGLAMVGKTNREIANELILAEGTIKTHLHNIMKKCGAANRDELKRDFWAS